MKAGKSSISAFKWTFSLVLAAVLFLSSGLEKDDKDNSYQWTPQSKVAEVLFALGAKKPLHAIDSIDPEMAESGKELVQQGSTSWPDGSSSSRISKFFNCTDCHNVKKEDPDLSISDPEARLSYAIDQDLPFLQGTTHYGLVNRESWYNGDYVEKYGDLARDARDTLRNAIQLCATKCSQGRLLTDREMEAMLHYFWSIGLTLNDIGIGIKRIEELENAAASDDKKEKLIKDLKSRYLSGSPATFLRPLPKKERLMGKKGDPKRGRHIYEKSCQHCHMPGKGITRFTLDRSVLTFKKLKKHFGDFSEHSIYQVIRYGISPKKGYRPYMPHYTKQRMSDRQIEDLAAYIRKKANGK